MYAGLGLRALQIVLLILLLVSGCKDNPVSVDPSYHNTILFTSRRSDKQQLYTMNPNGSNLQQITHPPYQHWGGKWSGDAKRIVCNTDEILRTDGNDMVIISPDGSYRLHIGLGQNMAWSPPGDKILFLYCPSCEGGLMDIGIYICDVNGANPMRVPVQGGLADWAPDGKAIVYGYANLADTSRISEIRTVAYPNFFNIRTISSGHVGYPAWSPSGNEIVFTGWIADSGVYRYQADLFLSDTSGSNVRPITEHFTMEQYLYPRWSPDGSKILFVSYLQERAYLYMVNRDGTNLHRVLDDSTVTTADWSW